MPLCCVVLVIFVMFLHTEKCLWKNKDQIIFTIPVLYWINHFLHGIAAWGNAAILNQGMWTPRGTLCGCAGYIWKLSCNFSGYKSNSTRFVWMNYENRANKSSSPLFLFTFIKKKNLFSIWGYTSKRLRTNVVSAIKEWKPQSKSFTTRERVL